MRKLSNDVALSDLFHEYFHLIHFVEECTHLLISLVLLRRYSRGRRVTCRYLGALDCCLHLIIQSKHGWHATILNCSIQSVYLLTRVQKLAVLRVLGLSWSRVADVIGYFWEFCDAFEDLLFLEFAD